MLTLELLFFSLLPCGLGNLCPFKTIFLYTSASLWVFVVVLCVFFPVCFFFFVTPSPVILPVSCCLFFNLYFSLAIHLVLSVLFLCLNSSLCLITLLSKQIGVEHVLHIVDFLVNKWKLKMVTFARDGWHLVALQVVHHGWWLDAVSPVWSGLLPYTLCCVL